MTPCDVSADEQAITLAGTLKIVLPGGAFTVEVEQVKTEDARLRPVWGNSLRRIRLVARKFPARGEFTLRLMPV
jgi:hypothetical protein